MKVPEIMEKISEKIKEMSGINSIPVEGITMSVKVNIELDDEQFNELINMLKSMGYSFYNVGYNEGIDGQYLIMEVYHNSKTGEFIAIDYTKGEKYMIGTIIYYRDNDEVHS